MQCTKLPLRWLSRASKAETLAVQRQAFLSLSHLAGHPTMRAFMPCGPGSDLLALVPVGDMLQAGEWSSKCFATNLLRMEQRRKGYKRWALDRGLPFETVRRRAGEHPLRAFANWPA